MKHSFASFLSPLIILALLLSFSSCKEQKTYFFLPSDGIQGRGGSGSGGSAPLQVSSDKYEIYSGSSYWGEEGKASVNQHYQSYSDPDRNYNYYRGSED